MCALKSVVMITRNPSAETALACCFRALAMRCFESVQALPKHSQAFSDSLAPCSDRGVLWYFGSVLGLARGVSLSDDTMINQNAVTAQSSTPHNESLPLKEQLWSGIVTASRIGRHAAWLD